MIFIHSESINFLVNSKLEINCKEINQSMIFYERK